MNFTTLNYLSTGTLSQKYLFEILEKIDLWKILSDYDPLLVGTFPIDIQVQGSDADILCQYDDLHEFVTFLKTQFNKFPRFQVGVKKWQGMDTVVASFYLHKLPIEVFAQPIPPVQQRAYKHLLVEYAVLREEGECFKQRVVELKQQGVKTEPAFALLLGLTGDPYESLIDYGVKKGFIV